MSVTLLTKTWWKPHAWHVTLGRVKLAAHMASKCLLDLSWSIWQKPLLVGCFLDFIFFVSRSTDVTRLVLQYFFFAEKGIIEFSFVPAHFVKKKQPIYVKWVIGKTLYICGAAMHARQVRTVTLPHLYFTYLVPLPRCGSTAQKTLQLSCLLVECITV